MSMNINVKINSIAHFSLAVLMKTPWPEEPPSKTKFLYLPIYTSNVGAIEAYNEISIFVFRNTLLITIKVHDSNPGKNK